MVESFSFKTQRETHIFDVDDTGWTTKSTDLIQFPWEAYDLDEWEYA